MPFEISQTPSIWLQKHQGQLKRGARILDVAAGYGRNSRYLVEQGLMVEAVDIDHEALSSLQGINNLSLKQADLENQAWPYAPAEFDAVLVCRYLHRPLFPSLLAVLRVGGVLLYETFMQGHEKFGRPSNPHYLLASSELKDYFSKDMQVIDYEEGFLQETPPAMLQRICAIKK